MKICQACEKFEKRVKKWNYIHGAIDPLPYIDDMIKPHKHLIFEGKRYDGAGGSLLSFQCLKCDQWWKLYAWRKTGYQAATILWQLTTCIQITDTGRRSYCQGGIFLQTNLNAGIFGIGSLTARVWFF
ncbi:MAG: hypothetical protein JRE27_01625 [Deltaproteobacteria bacterium]|nr:hypothetical protein [Deltaproteobacteria bacterium]